MQTDVAAWLFGEGPRKCVRPVGLFVDLPVDLRALGRVHSRLAQLSLVSSAHDCGRQSGVLEPTV